MDLWTMLMDGDPIPPCLDCPLPGPVESFFALSLCFIAVFFFVLLTLPEPWTDAIWKIAFPFAPRRKA